MPRTNAKECAELGIERDSFSVHHKCHIQQARNAAVATRAAVDCFTAWCYPPPLPPTKFLRFFISQVMVHATVGFAFDGTPENGGHGLKISLDRACCARVALKDQRKATRHADGSLHYDGELIRRKGDVYFVDANVTGSNQGTSTNPKYALKDLWEHKLFPRIDALVGPGGPYEGYHVVLQQDGAGPHKEGCFDTYLNAEIEARERWQRIDQGPNGPYMNALDAVVFPSMSKQHSKLLQQNNNTAVSKEKIMEKAEQVWLELPSYVIARAYVQIFRLMGVVIKEGGNNQWLSKGAPHLNVRKDFHKTEKGCAKIVVVH